MALDGFNRGIAAAILLAQLTHSTAAFAVLLLMGKAESGAIAKATMMTVDTVYNE